LLILVQIRVLRYAYMQLGVSSGTAFFLLFASLLGSYVNIPIAALGEEVMVTEREVTFFGMRYIVPALVEPPEVILAVNVGGAVIPTLLSIYLLSKNRLWGRGLIAIFASPRSAMPCSADPRGRNRIANLRGAFGRSLRRCGRLLAQRGAAGLRRWLPWRIDWRRPPQFGQTPGARGARPLDWRRRQLSTAFLSPA